jgi:K+-sensing histidine kinase KdpD
MTLYEREDFDLKPEQVNIDDMVNNLIHHYSVPAGRKTDMQYHNEAGSSLLRADRLHLYNVINNLVDNAVKYGGEDVAIDIRYYRYNGYYVLAVQDNGPGIPKQHLPFVFDKFYRVPTHNIYKVKGFGLGLSYVRSIMQKHDGWCRAESQVGHGSIFKLGFPA